MFNENNVRLRMGTTKYLPSIFMNVFRVANGTVTVDLVNNKTCDPFLITRYNYFMYESCY